MGMTREEINRHWEEEAKKYKNQVFSKADKVVIQFAKEYHGALVNNYYTHTRVGKTVEERIDFLRNYRNLWSHNILFPELDGELFTEKITSDA